MSPMPADRPESNAPDRGGAPLPGRAPTIDTCHYQASPDADEVAYPAGRWLGDYELLVEIGKGGMGIVYKARDGKLNRLVAVKVLRTEKVDESEAQRFRTEAEAMARIQHPGVTQIFEIGESAGARPGERMLARWRR
jgi:serine/threonine protein kinase